MYFTEAHKDLERQVIGPGLIYSPGFLRKPLEPLPPPLDPRMKSITYICLCNIPQSIIENIRRRCKNDNFFRKK